MSSAARLRPDDAQKLRQTARVVGAGLLTFGALQIAAAYLAKNRTGGAAVQAVIAEFAAGWLAVAWSDPHGPVATTATLGRRAARGALFGLGAAALVLGFALATGAAKLAPAPLAVANLFFGLILAGLLAMRDELVLRGIVLRALHDAAPPTVALLVCGLAAAAARFGLSSAAADPGATPLREALVAGLGGVAFAALWLRDRGAWVAWAAHVTWLWATGTAAQGGLFDLRWAGGRWGGGDAGLEGSLAGAVAVGIVAAVAAGWALAEKPASPAGGRG